MWIKSIELTNFQKHESFKADLSQGVNAIFGESDIGKSCIVRAFKWVMFGEPKGDLVRKEGTDRTSVKIVLDNECSIEKIKGNKENAYVIVKNCETFRLDAIGKVVPQEVRTLLGVFPMEIDKDEIILNVAPQIAVPFMLTESSTFRMKVFNKLTGNDILDLVNQSFNRDILRVGRDAKMRQVDLENRKLELGEIKIKEERQKLLVSTIKSEFSGVQKRFEQYTKVELLKNRLFEVETNLSTCKENITNIRLVDLDIIAKIRCNLEGFNEISNISIRNYNNNRWIETAKLELQKIRVPEGVPELRMRTERFNELNKLSGSIRSNQVTWKDTREQLSKIDLVITIRTNEYIDVLKECKTCPICRTKITDEIIESISLR